MASVDPIQTVIVVLTLSLFVFIYIPVIIVNAYKYGLNRFHIVFQKRYAKVTIIVVVIIVIQLLFNCMSFTIQYLINRPENDNNLS